MLLMRPYSEDLRRTIVAAVERGMPKTEAARTFGVSPSSVKRYWRLAAREEPLAPRKGGGRPPKANAATARLPEEDVARRPYAAARERADFLCAPRAGSGSLSPPSGGSCAQARVLPKKRSLGASERDEFLRAAWRAEASGKLAAERLVFVDEMGSNTSLSPLYGWSRVGERLLAKAPRNWGKNVTLISSLTLSGMGPSVGRLRGRPPGRPSRPASSRRCAPRSRRARWW